MRRASVNRQRILAVGDALRNIGNIYNTVHYAPSQQFSSPVEQERKFYQQDKAQRDAVNQRYMAYKAQRDALEERKARMQAQAAYQNASLALSAERLAEQKSQNEFMNNYRLERNVRLLRQLGLTEDKLKEFIRHNQATEGIGWARVGVSQQNADLNEWKANNPEQRTSTVVKTGSDGKTTTSTTTTNVSRGGGSSSGGGKSKKPNPMGGSNKKPNPMG